MLKIEHAGKHNPAYGTGQILQINFLWNLVQSTYSLKDLCINVWKAFYISVLICD